MAAISLKLPDSLIQQSDQLAKELGVSRTALIRRALRHEIQRSRRTLEQQAIISDLAHLSADRNYLAETDQLDAGCADLPEEKDFEDWWIHPKP